MQEKTDQMMHYETLYVVHPVHASKNQEIKERLQGVLASQGAEITHFEEWGLRDLAYPIQKQFKGYYNLVQFRALPGTTEELERIMRLSDEVMRCLTVVLDEDVRPIGVEREAESAVSTDAAQAPASSEPEAERASEPEASTATETVAETRQEPVDPPRS